MELDVVAFGVDLVWIGRFSVSGTRVQQSQVRDHVSSANQVRSRKSTSFVGSIRFESIRVFLCGPVAQGEWLGLWFAQATVE